MTKPIKAKGYIKSKFIVEGSYVKCQSALDDTFFDNWVIVARLATKKTAEKLAADLNGRLSEIKNY